MTGALFCLSFVILIRNPGESYSSIWQCSLTIILHLEAETIYVTYYIISKGYLLNFYFWDGAFWRLLFAKIWDQITLWSLPTIPLSQDFALGLIGQKSSKSTFLQHPKDVHIHLVEKNWIRKQCFSKLDHGCMNLFAWIRISCSWLQVQVYRIWILSWGAGKLASFQENPE